MDSFFVIASILRGIYCLALFLTALFLILLVLIQRGRGGGLAGAFGGMGGQSAFGAKAGDTFTKITIVVATFWIILCIVGVKFGGQEDSIMSKSSGPVMSAAPADEAEDGAATNFDDLESPPAESSSDATGATDDGQSAESAESFAVPASDGASTGSESSDEGTKPDSTSSSATSASDAP